MVLTQSLVLFIADNRIAGHRDGTRSSETLRISFLRTLCRYLQRLGGNELSVGVAMTVGAVPALLFLFKSEHIVDYWGHSNILITAFTVYIIR